MNFEDLVYVTGPFLTILHFVRLFCYYPHLDIITVIMVMACAGLNFWCYTVLDDSYHFAPQPLIGPILPHPAPAA
jgi:hypothetical protein